MKKPLLEVNNLTVSFKMNRKDIRFKNCIAVNDLSIKVYPGEILTIVGSSGSGKSILAHTILNLLPRNSVVHGEIYYDGKILDENLLKKLRGNEITFIPQSVSYLDPVMKVGKQVRYCSNSTESKKTQRKIFKNYDLCENTEKLYPFQLSGGMVRKVLIGTSAMKNPRLIIADEPTPGLDLKAAEKTMNYFKSFADEDKAVVLITHDIELAVNYSDKIAIFYGGYILELTKAKYFKEGIDKLRHPYTRALYESLPSNGFKALEGFQPASVLDDKSCIYKERCIYRIDKCYEKVESNIYDDEMVKCNYDFRSEKYRI